MRQPFIPPSAADLDRLLAWLRREGGDASTATADGWLQAIAMLPHPTFIKDRHSLVRMMNPACEALWGVGFDVVGGTDGGCHFSPEELAVFRAHDQLAFTRRDTIVEEAALWHAGLHEQRWLLTFKHPTYDADGQPHLLICSCIDITERKRQETGLAAALHQAQLTASQRQDGIDHLHRRLARGMQDGLAQNLVALKLDIAMLQARTGAAQPLLHARATQALATLDATIDAVREVVNELHPATLELGLCAAVEWQLQQMQRRLGLPCRLRVRDDSAELAPSHTRALFHVAQAGLEYLAPQAQALDVELDLGRGQCRIAILREPALAIAEAPPLAAMRERLGGLGGSLHMRPGALLVTVPGPA